MIKLQNISKVFNGGKSSEKVALSDVSLEIDDGEFIAIVGKSGAGKSTLMNIVGCLDNPTDGSYLLNGQEVAKLPQNSLAELRNKYFGIITQSPFLIDNISPLENVVIPLMLDKNKKKGRYELANDALFSVGLQDISTKKTCVLSGGEQQRVSIARAIVNDPKIILADEPTGALDSENSEIIMNILTKINEAGKTVIIITHNMEIAAVCRRVITVRDGKLIKDETVAD